MKKVMSLIVLIFVFFLFVFTALGIINVQKISQYLIFNAGMISYDGLSFFVFGAAFLLALLMGILLWTLKGDRSKRMAFLIFDIFIVGYAFWITNIFAHYFMLAHFVEFMTTIKMLINITQILFFYYYFEKIFKSVLIYRILFYCDYIFNVVYFIYAVTFHSFGFFNSEYVYAVSLIPILIILNTINGYRSIKFGWNIFLVCNWYEIIILIKMDFHTSSLVRLISITSFVLLVYVMTGVFYIELKKLQKKLMLSSLYSHKLFSNDRTINMLHDIKNRLVFLENQYDQMSMEIQKKSIREEIEILKEKITKYQGEDIRHVTQKYIEKYFENQKSKYGKFVKFSYSIDKDSEFILTEMDFEILFNHLLSNAYNATLTKKEKIISVEYSSKYIAITDNGIGFKAKGKNPHSTKVGMDTIYKITYIYGGRIKIKSKKNFGTNIKIYLNEGGI